MSEEGSFWDKVLSHTLKLFDATKLSRLNQCEIIELCLLNPVRSITEEFLKKVKKSDFKDSGIALQKKEEGNEKYKKRQFKESLSLYTESIFHAAKDDECLPLAYSNRSMVLELMGHLSESLIDIDMALTCGYPKQKVDNLMLRKARCLAKVGDVEKAKEILTEMLKNSGKKEFHKVIENELKQVKDMKKKDTESSEKKLPEPVGGENKNFPGASKYLSLCYDETRGRHVIANKDFEPGDVLIVEKAFAHIVFGKSCATCFKNTIAPYPCWKCTDTYYCSPKCRDDSWNSYHSFECGFAKLFRSIGIAHLGLRVILRVSHCLEDLKKVLDGITEPVYENGSVVHISEGYESVYNLVHHSDRYEPSEMFQYAMTAFLLAMYLKNYTSYFPSESDYEDLNLVTSIILRHILQTICNGFCNTEVPSVTLGETEKLTKIRTGTSINTCISMLNHSCEPSASLNSFENYSVVRAEVSIKKGEELCLCYGPFAKMMKKSQRQEILRKQYFFECKCRACLQKYDVYDKFTAFKCIECTGPSVRIEENSQETVCLSCGRKSSISPETTSKFSQFYSLLEEGEIQLNCALSLKIYLQAWTIGRGIFYKFHMDVTRAAGQVAIRFVKLREFGKGISFLKCCVRSVEEHFGPLSFELAVEMKNIADIITVYLINNKDAKDAEVLAREALVYYKKIQKIFSLFPEGMNFEELECNILVLQMHLQKV